MGCRQPARRQQQGPLDPPQGNAARSHRPPSRFGIVSAGRPHPLLLSVDFPGDWTDVPACGLLGGQGEVRVERAHLRDPRQTGKGSQVRMAVRYMVLILLLPTAVGAQGPTSGYAPVNGLRMYYEVHGKGEPVILLHGSFMTITNNWAGMIPRLSKTRQVIAVEMQGHGRTADIDREFSYAHLADDVAALL